MGSTELMLARQGYNRNRQPERDARKHCMGHGPPRQRLCTSGHYSTVV